MRVCKHCTCPFSFRCQLALSLRVLSTQASLNTAIWMHPYKALMTIQVFKSIFTCGAAAKADHTRVCTQPAEAAYGPPPGQTNDSEEPAASLPVSQPALADVRSLPRPLMALAHEFPAPALATHCDRRKSSMCMRAGVCVF